MTMFAMTLADREKIDIVKLWLLTRSLSNVLNFLNFKGKHLGDVVTKNIFVCFFRECSLEI